MNTKPWYTSKTIWLNVIGFIVYLIQYQGLATIIPENIVAFIVMIGNLLLRPKTDTVLTVRSNKI